MSFAGSISTALTGRSAVRAGGNHGLLLVAGVILLSFLMPWRAGDNTDVSWLIVVCEKILDGERLYVDILETNPPFSIALYFGPVWLARRLAMSPEALVECTVYLSFALAMALSGWVIARGRLFADLPTRWTLPALAFLLLILPGNVFGQREHLGVMLFMPMLFLMIWRAEAGPGRVVPWGLAVAVGLAASVLMLVKPHWALGIALPYLVICWRRRTPFACLTPENFVIGTVCVGYLASVWFWFPEFLDTFLPLLMRYYVSLRANMNAIVALPTFAVFVLFVVVQMRNAGWRTDVVVCLASAAGFFVSMVYLGKYWDNHQYPYQVALSAAMLLAVAARWRQVAEAGEGSGSAQRSDARLHAGAALAAIAALSVAHQFYQNPEQRLVDAIGSRYAAPTVVQISSDLSVGHPLTRRVNGRWLSQYAHDWVGAHALWGIMQHDYEGEDEQVARRDLDDYTNYLTGLLRDAKPDIVLIDRLDKEPSWSLAKQYPPIWVVWMRQNAEFTSLMQKYELIALGDYIEVYARRKSDGGRLLSSSASPASVSD